MKDESVNFISRRGAPVPAFDGAPLTVAASLLVVIFATGCKARVPDNTVVLCPDAKYKITTLRGERVCLSGFPGGALFGESGLSVSDCEAEMKKPGCRAASAEFYKLQ